MVPKKTILVLHFLFINKLHRSSVRLFTAKIDFFACCLSEKLINIKIRKKVLGKAVCISDTSAGEKVYLWHVSGPMWHSCGSCRIKEYPQREVHASSSEIYTSLQYWAIKYSSCWVTFRFSGTLELSTPPKFEVGKLLNCRTIKVLPLRLKSSGRLNVKLHSSLFLHSQVFY